MQTFIMTFSGDMKICLGEEPDIGRGVFAQRDIKKGEIIEVCPVIVVPRDQLTFLDQLRRRFLSLVI